MTAKQSVHRNTNIKDGTQKAANDDLTSYDEVEYSGQVFGNTVPNHIGAIAKMFGLNTADPSKARVLEMGGGDGINIIQLAAKYPDAEFVEVDLSKVQIAKGQELVKRLGLKNIVLHHMSIADIDESFGKFDYIICHGVYSWVPEAVRAKIFENCKKLLSPNGIAYISHNTSPGWNMPKTVRDLMLFHTEGFKTYEEKVQQAKAILNFVYDAVKDEDSPYSKLLKQEVESIANHRNDYIFHDYMSEENHRPYLYEFISEADAHGLQYLANADLFSMLPINCGANAAAALSQIENDLVRQEQYIDFIMNNRFRRTILCHADAKVSRAINTNFLDDMYLASDVSIDKDLTEANIKSSETVNFTLHSGMSGKIHMASSNPNMKACFYAMMRCPMLFKLDELYSKAQEVYSEFNKDAIDAEFRVNLLRAVFGHGALLYLTRPYRVSKEMSQKPKLWKLALFQAQNDFYILDTIINQFSTPVRVNPFQKTLMKFLDGTHDFEALVNKIVAKIEDKTLTISADNNVITDLDEIREAVSLNVNYNLEILDRFGMLE